MSYPKPAWRSVQWIAVDLCVVAGAVLREAQWSACGVSPESVCIPRGNPEEDGTAGVPSASTAIHCIASR
jgi:hypothetical protein